MSTAGKIREMPCLCDLILTKQIGARMLPNKVNARQACAVSSVYYLDTALVPPAHEVGTQDERRILIDHQPKTEGTTPLYHSHGRAPKGMAGVTEFGLFLLFLFSNV